MDKKGYYKVLGLTEEESKLPWDNFEPLCKKKYRELALRFHPDRWVNGTDEEKRNAVKEIQSKALSSFYLKYGLVILACLFVVLVKYLKLRNSLY